ncbi:MAG: DUF4864 domain-containing protein [Natronospirillum sp.]|uniref:DUF4864 domain-containing protein n=1 Tax=Natronospirillum sp. TaxID=2812955 RepID=UPI0025F1BE08|nr:DUF4864 domain-containing protein [Natronospirillum sp.]MCH8550555.1 DUF4864 domain-containing protein [Natronospirillum sp.]
MSVFKRCLLLCVVCLATPWVMAQSLADAEVVIRDQIEAFGDGDAERAYSHASDGIRAQFDTPEFFVAMVRSQYDALYNPRQLSFAEPMRVSDERMHQEVLVLDRSGQNWRAVYSLVAVEGRWRIEGVVMRSASRQAV